MESARRDLSIDVQYLGTVRVLQTIFHCGRLVLGETISTCRSSYLKVVSSVLEYCTDDACIRY
jgi:hypothetical protein